MLCLNLVHLWVPTVVVTMQAVPEDSLKTMNVLSNCLFVFVSTAVLTKLFVVRLLSTYHLFADYQDLPLWCYFHTLNFS